MIAVDEMTEDERPSPRERFTEEEDAIILGTEGLHVRKVIQRLVDSGYPARTPGSIYNRRAYLKKMPQKAAAVVSTATAIAARMRAVEAEIETLRDELDQRSEELKNLKQRHVESLRRELEQALVEAEAGEGSFDEGRREPTEEVE